MPKYEFVAVDFDGTLCADAFPEVGAPNRAVIAYVKKLAADGSKIILYTSRENGTRKLLDEAVAFCKAQEIPLYAVNENPGNPHAAKSRFRRLAGGRRCNSLSDHPFSVLCASACATTLPQDHDQARHS